MRRQDAPTLSRVPLALLGLVAAAGCTDLRDLPLDVGSFQVTIVSGDTGTRDKPLTFSSSIYTYLTLEIEARRNDDADLVDSTFNGWAVVQITPTGETERTIHAVQFKNGQVKGEKVGFRGAFGEARLMVTDVGYVPAKDPGNAACINGVDDDGDGYVDVTGGDRGCFVGGDDTESGGTGSTGASPPIFVTRPRIADIQKPILGKAGDRSPLERSRVTVDRGWMLVTRLGTDGMYLTDFEGIKRNPADTKWLVTAADLSYDSIFVFNFSTPVNLQEGDCLVQLDGTVEEFYGYTELGKPTWKKGDFGFCGVKAFQAGLKDCPDKETAGGCNSGQPCPTDFKCVFGVCRPDPSVAKHQRCRRQIEVLANTPVDLSTLMITDQGVSRSVWNEDYLMTERFESALVQVSNVNLFSEARKCDFNGNQIIDFYAADGKEKDCSNDCGDDVKCVVWESYRTYGTWTVNFEDGEKEAQEVGVVSAGAIQDFDPLQAYEDAAKAGTPMTLGKVVGTLRQLSFGRPPWSIEPRRPSDCPDCKNKK